MPGPLPLQMPMKILSSSMGVPSVFCILLGKNFLCRGEVKKLFCVMFFSISRFDRHPSWQPYRP